MPATSEEIYCIEGGETKREHVFLQTEDNVPQIDGSSSGGLVLAKKSQGGGKKYEYTQPTRTEGFILRLLLQQLDVSLVELAVILKCSDKITGKEAHDLVQTVINRYVQKGFIRLMTKAEVDKIKMSRDKMITDSDPPVKPPKPFDKLDLNASINQINPSIFMISFPPLM